MKYKFPQAARQFFAGKKSAFSKRVPENCKPAMERLEGRTLLSNTPIVYSYVTDQSNYQASPGQTVTVNVYLKETLNGNTSIIDGNGEGGLFGAGFEVESGTRPPSPSIITAVNYDSSDFAGLNGVNLNNNVVSNPNEADVDESVSLAAVTGVELANGNGAAANEVYLGSLTIVAGASPGTTSFSLGERALGGSSGSTTITFENGYDLDVSGTTPTSYTGAGTTVTTFSVTAGNPVPPTPTLTITSGNITYTSNGYAPATTVTGTAGTDSGALLTYTYYSGSGANAPSLGSTAPTGIGSYLVVAHFAGDSTYGAADSAPKAFQITAATPTVVVSDAGGTFTGAPFVATATVTGADGTPEFSLEGVTLTITYYSGSTVTGSPLDAAPTAVGTYTVVAQFPGSADYNAASGSAVTFAITQVASVPPVISAQSFTINSKPLAGAVVGIVVASDPSGGETLTYGLSADPTPQAIDYTGAFQIDDQGVVTIKDPAQLPAVGRGQTKNATFQVTVTNLAGLSTSAIITVSLNPLQAMAPTFNVAPPTYTFPEAGKRGVKVGTLAATVAYKGQKIAYTPSGADAAMFAINARGLISTRGVLDYFHSTGHTYSFNVVATDRKTKGANAASATVAVTVAVTDGSPTISRAVAGQTVKAGKTISPLKKVRIGDVIAAHIDALTITLDNSANGAFTTASLSAVPGISWTADSTTGVYTTSGTPANLTKAIAKLVYQPTSGVTATTTFTLAVSDGAATTTNDTTTVVSA